MYTLVLTKYLKTLIATTMTDLKPASNIKELWRIFNPTNVISSQSSFYVERTEHNLQKLSLDLEESDGAFKGFLCGHVGSGKTTELLKLCQDSDLQQQFCTIYLSVSNFQYDHVTLTHDALMVEMVKAMLVKVKEHILSLSRDYEKELNDWGKTIIDTFVHDEKVQAQAGLKASVLWAYFKAQLSTRRSWTQTEKLVLEPKVQDLIELLNSLAIEFKSNIGKSFLIVLDDLEKGESEKDKQMHYRLFNDYYNELIQPNINIIYSLPVYFRSLPTKRVDDDRIYSFSSIRLYDLENKKEHRPKLDTNSEGYQLIKNFIAKRIIDENTELLFAPHTVDELIRIGGGLLRETARCIREAAYHALYRKADQIEPEDVLHAFNKVKKDYQPQIRGKAIAILKEVAECKTGWVDNVEPHLQSGAVVEYENGDYWLDVRYPLKSFVANLGSPK